MKKITFSVAILKIGDEPFDPSVFDVIQDKETNDMEIAGQIVQNIVIEKNTKDNRFVFLSFEEGDALPRPSTVYNTNSKEDEENPRNENQIERDDQTFVLVDCQTQRIYISDFRKKKEIQDRFSKKLNKFVLVKNVIDRDAFLNETKSIGSIYMSAAPTLFSTTGILGEELANDFHNYGVGIKHIGVSLKFQENTLPERLKEKIISLFHQQETQNLDKLVISGRSADDKFERVFNAEGIVDKISIDVTEEDTGLFDTNKIFLSLITKILG